MMSTALKPTEGITIGMNGTYLMSTKATSVIRSPIQNRQTNMRLPCSRRSLSNFKLLNIQRAHFSTSSEPVFVQQLQEKDSTGISVLTLNRTVRKNALSKSFTLNIQENVEKIQHDPDIRVLLIRSSVLNIFCAGADLKERLDMSPEEAGAMSGLLRVVFNQISLLPYPTIACMDGAAVGGGLELALACDLRIASSSAKIGLPETSLAIIPGAGGTQRLPRIIGISKAKDLIFRSRVLDGRAACELGVVHESVTQTEDGDAAFQRGIIIAREISSRGPVAVRAAKIAIDEGSQVDLKRGLEIEGECYQMVLPTEDRMEALRAFVEKRKPKYRGG